MWCPFTLTPIIMRDISWKSFEQLVRQIANLKWRAMAVSENIAGVNFDCVLKLNSDRWIIIEVSEKNDLQKVREDIAKCAATRMTLFGKNIYSEFYIVLKNSPTDLMRNTASSAKISLLSIDEFESYLFDFNRYSSVRMSRPFGSAVDPISGNPDRVNYTPVSYELTQSHKTIELTEIIKYLLDRRKVILIGDYGTGKSRCLQELFSVIVSQRKTKFIYPISINLKENWGTQSAEEIVRRHFDNLGLSDLADTIVSMIGTDSLLFLLDGFDEIGSQSWSDDARRLRQIRANALKGVKDLIQKSRGGVIVSGRNHYFNSDEEMYALLGITTGGSTLVKCKDEFSQTEMRNYLMEIADGIPLPSWLPRRPLICQIIASLDKDELERVFIENDSPVEFWKTLFEMICNREGRINAILDPSIIRAVLIEIARKTRTKSANYGPISVNEINGSFEKITGTPPIDESSVMLQRLPALGRISAETADRQFVDYYILDGLRAENLIEVVNANDHSILDERWMNPLGDLGLEVVAAEFNKKNNINAYIEYLKATGNADNKVIQGDLLASIVSCQNSDINLNNILISDTHIRILDLSRNKVRNFSITNSVIEVVDISSADLEGIQISKCIISKLIGVSSEVGVPPQIDSCEIESYDSVNNMSRIKASSLSMSHKIFVSIIQKTFFQKGAGRQEETLYRGFTGAVERKMVRDVLNKLKSEGVLESIKLENGYVFKPKRHFTSRMSAIVSDLTRSKDPLWSVIDDLN